MSQDKIKVGVLGATGAVGQRFVQLLQGHPWFEITALCASERSAGKRYADACRWNLRGDMPAHLRDVILEECEPGVDCRIVFSALPAESATKVEKEFAAAGYIVCSNARSYRYEPDVPLLIPEVNPEHLGLIDVQRRNRGWDGFITSGDFVTCLRDAGLEIAENPSSKKDLAAIQAQVNAWAGESGFCRTHIARICALSVGENYDAETIIARARGGD